MPLSELRVHEWARRWLAEQWQEWQPRTRTSAAEALARFITIAVAPGAKVPEGLRVYLYAALSPNLGDQRDAAYEKWMAKNCMPWELDDSVRFAERAVRAEVDVTLNVGAGLWQVFPAWWGAVPEADARA